jgi:hypothetical protein
MSNQTVVDETKYPIFSETLTPRLDDWIKVSKKHYNPLSGKNEVMIIIFQEQEFSLRCETYSTDELCKIKEEFHSKRGRKSEDDFISQYFCNEQYRNTKGVVVVKCMYR